MNNLDPLLHQDICWIEPRTKHIYNLWCSFQWGWHRFSEQSAQCSHTLQRHLLHCSLVNALAPADMVFDCFDIIYLLHHHSLCASRVAHFAGIPIHIKFGLLVELENLLCEGSLSSYVLHKGAILHFLVQSVSCLR